MSRNYKLAKISIKLRALQHDDLPSIYSILQQLSKFWPSEDTVKLYNQFCGEHVFSIVAMDNFTEQVIGFGCIFFMHKIRGGLQGQIEDIAVHKDYHHLGIGRLIVNELIEKAKHNKAYKVMLSCKKENLRFYEALGFDAKELALVQPLLGT